MIKTPAIISEVDTSAALGYLLKHVSDSRFVEYLARDALISECENISVVASLPCPRDAKYDAPIGGPVGSSGLWLREAAVAYLRGTPDGVVLGEDLVSLPSDPGLAKRDHPPFWCYEDRLFWPVLPSEATCDAIAQMMSWAASMREVVCFSKVPYKHNLALETRFLTQEEFVTIASSIKSLVTDVFDGEGYMIWNRRNR